MWGWGGDGWSGCAGHGGGDAPCLPVPTPRLSAHRIVRVHAGRTASMAITADGRALTVRLTTRFAGTSMDSQASYTAASSTYSAAQLHNLARINYYRGLKGALALQLDAQLLGQRLDLGQEGGQVLAAGACDLVLQREQERFELLR